MFRKSLTKIPFKTRFFRSLNLFNCISGKTEAKRKKGFDRRKSLSSRKVRVQGMNAQEWIFIGRGASSLVFEIKENLVLHPLVSDHTIKSKIVLNFI